MEHIVANYSNFSIELSGNPFQLRAAYDEFTQLTHWHFQISEIYEESLTPEPPTWSIDGCGRWGIDMNALTDLAIKYTLSGIITDAEPGSGFFIQVELADGEVTYSCNTDYMSDEHYNFNPDNRWWLDSYYHALEEPNEYPEVIEFLLKHNIIDQEDLNART